MQNFGEGTRIFGSQVIDELKRVEDGLRRKSRLVAQNYSDGFVTESATMGPNIQRLSQIILLILAASFPGFSAFTLHVTQAIFQSDSELERSVYLHPPVEMA